MWAQLITMRLKAGADDRITEVAEQLRAIEQPGSGLVHSFTMRDQHDSNRVITLVVFESEEIARAREQDPRRNEGLAGVRALMGEVLDGPPEFVDLDVVASN